jgi:GT2 family glycosyltransferase
VNNTPRSVLDASVPCSPLAPIAADGKFLRAGGERFHLKGVTYGTFAPDVSGCQFPAPARVADDFRAMAALGVNTVRVYTPPPIWLLDEAARCGLRVMAGIPWTQHVAFLDDPQLLRGIRRDVRTHVGLLKDHPAVALFSLGSEIPPGVVRWHGRGRLQAFLRELYDDAKAIAPDSLFTYANFPPTEFLELDFLDVCAFNVYLHREQDLRGYLARLQHVAGTRPLLLAEAGADSMREGLEGQADITARHIRVAFEEGACGAIAFAWTDEWWRGGNAIEDWAFGLVDRDRNPKPAAAAVAAAFQNAPFPQASRASWPRVSVVVCAYNAAGTLDDCLSSLGALDYPDYEVILVNDGSRDATSEVGRRYPHVRVVNVPNNGLSVARNIGLAEASGEIIAYTDADVRVDRDWLTYLVQPFLHSDVAGSGGPNAVPPDDPPLAQCVARAPGAPTHVLLDDRIAEHVPGCNMAFRRDALLAIGGFNPIYVRAGDDVDICWRLQSYGWRIGFAPAALVWHHHRQTIGAYWRQQVGYGEGETWLKAHHPEKFLDGLMQWHGRIYSPLPIVRSLTTTRVNSGVWGTAAFPSVYRTSTPWWGALPHSIGWQLGSLLLMLAALALGAFNRDLGFAVGTTGLAAIALTLAADAAYARQTNLTGLSARSRRWYRFTIFALHVLQPLARGTGRLRGWLSPAPMELPQQECQADVPVTWRDLGGALRLLMSLDARFEYWTERWVPLEQLMRLIADSLRQSRAVSTTVIDDGWSEDRDMSVYVSRCAWLDVRALLEEHESGRALLRIRMHLRPTRMAAVVFLAVAAGVSALTGISGRLDWLMAVVVIGLIAMSVRRVAVAAAAVRARVDRGAATAGLAAVAPAKAAPVVLAAPSSVRCNEKLLP